MDVDLVCCVLLRLRRARPARAGFSDGGVDAAKGDDT
jgi:hypothetical protein